jgi:hypothetical protein
MPYYEFAGKLIEVFAYDTTSFNKTYTPFQLDNMSKAIETIEYEHHEIHGGTMFRAGEEVALANDGTRVIHVKTPDTTKWAHMVYQMSNTLEAEFEFYEGPTVSNVGTAVPSYNRNRNSATAATTLVYHTPTTSASGTLLATRREGIGKTAGGSSRGVAEWILKQNTSYLLVFTSRAGAGTTNYVNWWIVWYEHTSR